MRPAEAREIVELLAQGIDPETGEVLQDDSAINHPRVVRALFAAAKALELAQSHTARHESSANAGTPWREEEDRQLAAAFDEGIPAAQLAKMHQRTAGAIASRLIRIGRVKVNKNVP